MSGRFRLAVAVTCLGLAVSAAYGQGSRFIANFDPDNDGKLKRSEVPEKLRTIYDNVVKKAGLDPEKTIDRAELERALDMGGKPGASSSSGSSTTGRSFGPPNRSSSSSSGFRPSSRHADGRRYRSLVELPSEYRDYDKDGDGQIGLYEWPRSRVADFVAKDKNNDGFLTLEELRKPGSGSSSKAPAPPSVAPTSERTGPPTGTSGPPSSPPPSGAPPAPEVKTINIGPGSAGSVLKLEVGPAE
jgi:hypothetical protein